MDVDGDDSYSEIHRSASEGQPEVYLSRSGAIVLTVTDAASHFVDHRHGVSLTLPPQARLEPADVMAIPRRDATIRLAAGGEVMLTVRPVAVRGDARFLAGALAATFAEARATPRNPRVLELPQDEIAPRGADGGATTEYENDGARERVTVLVCQLAGTDGRALVIVERDVAPAAHDVLLASLLWQRKPE